MFKPSSRYANAETYSVRTSDGRMVTAVRLPVREAPPVSSFHRRVDSQRLDLIAGHYLADATAFWTLCDAADGIAPDAVATRALVPIPVKGR